MTDRISPALTPEEWAGVQTGTVGIVGTPNAQANHQLAALCLYGQPFGFTREDVRALQFEGNDLLAWAGDAETDEERQRMNRHGFQLLNVADRIAALLPPETPA